MMAKKKMIGRVRRREPASRKEVERLETIREKVREEFPPSTTPRLRLPTGGIAARLRSAREAQGLTWYAVAKRAGIPNPGTVRDIEYGRDTKLSSIEAVAGVLGLRLELVGVGQRDG